MLNNISSVKLQGANFISDAELPIFDSSDGKYTKLSLMYGRNGSGKSTIAKTFRKIKGEGITTIVKAETIDTTNQPLVLSPEERTGIFVFDEDYVTKNVYVERDGLGSIVMLGEQVDLSAQIKSAEDELEKAKALVKTTADVLNEYQTKTNPKAPQYYLNKIYGVLQQNDGWAGRDSKVKGQRQNSRVTDTTYQKFVSLSPLKSRDELIIEFNSKMKDLEAAKGGTAVINTVVPSLPEEYKNISVSLANTMIKKKIEEPELSEREKYLLSLITKGGTDELNERIERINDEKTTFCPYCLQDLREEYKGDLIARIKKVLNDEVKEHQDQLRAMKITELMLEISMFSILPSYQSCIGMIDSVNTILNNNNILLQRKIDDPYSPIVSEELSEVKETVKGLAETLVKLEEERKIHNGKVIDTKPIMAALITINDQIAHYDVLDLSKQYEVQNTEMLAAKKRYDDAVEDQSNKNKKLEELNGKRKQIDIAIEIINNGLKYIFFTENRLSIKRDGDFYKILSNGKPVQPQNISVGERNIIGLCYFFTSILTGKKKDLAYKDEYLLVIDDPVSSYDFENKVGILSFLKYKLSQFLNGNVKSRAVIMTHDLLTLFDLEKIGQELAADWKNVFSGKPVKYNLWELKNCALKRFEYKKRQEYTELIKLVYEYGCGNAGEYDIVIGNIMRQALEAFSTFEYKKGIAEVSTDESLLIGMCEEHKTYFKNLMYRIVLNNGSHREEQVQSMEVDFLSVISEAEKRRTAKEIICFIYLLNKAHILAHLGNVSSEINTWCDEIRTRAAVI